MSIAIETYQYASASSASSVSTPSIVPAGTNRLLLAFGGNSDGSHAPVAYSDMTYGGAQMTPKWDVTQQTYLHNVCEYLVNPSTAGGIVQYSLASSDAILFVVAIALSGVDQATPMGTQSGASVAAATGPVSDVIASKIGDMVVNCFLGGGTSIAIGANETTSVEIENVLGACFGVSASNGATSVTTGWTRVGTTLAAGQVAANIQASAGKGHFAMGVGIGVGF